MFCEPRMDADDEDENSKQSMPEKTRKKLLDPTTWASDAFLVNTATAIQQEIGDGLFEDHNQFLEAFEVTLKKLKIKLSATDKKAIISAVSWRF